MVAMDVCGRLLEACFRRRLCASASALAPVADRWQARSTLAVGDRSTRCHEVSILTAMIGVDGRCRRLAPRSKTSMMIMRPPQHGQGRERGRLVAIMTDASAAWRWGSGTEQLAGASDVVGAAALANRP